MGIKQDIVLKSRFSVSYGPGRGSRGGSPGQFIINYMSRNGAVENVAPTRVSEAENYLRRYDVTSKAADEETSIPAIHRKVRIAKKKGGVAFSEDDVSLSDEKLKQKSREIQEQFDRGKTAIELILSFTESYLRDNGVLDPDFVHTKRGDFAGHVDQMKLRLAIMNGLEKLGRNYDDLRYVGCIQVDTDKIHCHLTLLDFGVGTMASDGRQRGKLTALDMRNIRRGIDSYLDEKQTSKMMSSSVMYDKRNTLCYVKKFTHRMLDEQGAPQFLLACLPKNKNYWSANSNRVEMRKPNAIVREFVLDILQPESGRSSVMYRDAYQSIVRYADARRAREGLTAKERMQLIRNGIERLIKDCMNGVYSVLKRIPSSDMRVQTPMMDAMSMDYETMAERSADDPMMEFGFKLRSYASRLRNHRKNYHKFKQERENYEKAEGKSEAAKALGDHLALERDYQQMLMVKYQHFLTFLPPDESFQTDFDEVMREQDRLQRMEQMLADPAFHRMGAVEAENYGWRVYGLNRGGMIKRSPDFWEMHINEEREKYQMLVDAFREKLWDHGFDFDGHGVTRKKLYEFDEVKALDLHHLGYDFSGDVPISKGNIDRFVAVANQRYESFLAAQDYLVQTGQEDLVEELLPTDVHVMKEFADKLSSGSAVLPSSRNGMNRRHDSHTVSLGYDYTMDMQTAVKSVVESVRQFE